MYLDLLAVYGTPTAPTVNGPTDETPQSLIYLFDLTALADVLANKE